MTDNIAVCDCEIIHEQEVEQARRAMPDAGELARTVALFRLLGDMTRLKLVAALQGRELCVCDLAALLQMSKSAVSHQLSELRRQQLVKFRRDGKFVFYSLDDEHVEEIIAMALTHVHHQKLQEDI
ncbi:MAG: metalloregulator ArsR/SmtB family transcription factor [Bacillota bacterium]|nr:metalloregulator ArsR/SmtB family transcription factor [Bacillota bacterium]